MPSFMGVGIIGIAPCGRREIIDVFDDYGGGGPLTIDEAVRLVGVYVREYAWHPINQYDSFEFHDSKLGFVRSASREELLNGRVV